MPDDVAAGLDSRSLKEVRGTLRVLAALDAPAPALLAPPAGLWDRIAADLDGTGGGRCGPRLRRRAGGARGPRGGA